MSASGSIVGAGGHPAGLEWSYSVGPAAKRLPTRSMVRTGEPESSTVRPSVVHGCAAFSATAPTGATPNAPHRTGRPSAVAASPRSGHGRDQEPTVRRVCTAGWVSLPQRRGDSADAISGRPSASADLLARCWLRCLGRRAGRGLDRHRLGAALGHDRLVTDQAREGPRHLGDAADPQVPVAQLLAPPSPIPGERPRLGSADDLARVGARGQPRTRRRTGSGRLMSGSAPRGTRSTWTTRSRPTSSG